MAKELNVNKKSSHFYLKLSNLGNTYNDLRRKTTMISSVVTFNAYVKWMSDIHLKVIQPRKGFL